MNTNIKIKASEQPMPRRITQRLRTRSAMALVGIMLVLMLLLASSLIGFAGMAARSSGDLGTSSSNALFLAKKRSNVQQAEIMADAGLRAAVQWISDQPSPPINISAFTPLEVTPTGFYPGSAPADSGKWTSVNFANVNGQMGSYKVRFYPHSDNAVAAQRGFLVESVGTYGGETRVVRADIRQKNFAQYAYFTDTLGDQHFIAGLTTFNGPVHINNTNNAQMPIVWNSGSISDMNVARLFQWDGDNSFTMWQGDKVGNTYANADKVVWKRDTPAATSVDTPNTSDEWKRIITPKTEGGTVTARTGPKLTAERVDMPTTSNELRDAALGGNAEPSANGVYVPTPGSMTASNGVPSGGIYIKGQVDDMVMEAGGTGNKDQTIYIYQGGNATTASNVKWKLTMTAAGTTTLQKFSRSSTTLPFNLTNDTGYPKTYSGGKPNGVIYSYDDIGAWGAAKGGLSGTVANSDTSGQALNKLTIATRVEGAVGSGNQKTINIDGNILYANATSKATQAPADSGVLGMVAGYIRVVKQARVEEPLVTGFANYTASIGVAYANNATLTDMSVHGTMMAFNTASVDNWDTRAPGEFNMVGGYIAKDPSKFGNVQWDTQNVLSGFKRILNYDKRVANQPPPYFPGTGQAYEALSYQRVLDPLQP